MATILNSVALMQSLKEVIQAMSLVRLLEHILIISSEPPFFLKIILF
jgi:hypothetical protein